MHRHMWSVGAAACCLLQKVSWTLRRLLIKRSWGWLLGLRVVCPNSFIMLYPLLLQDLFQQHSRLDNMRDVGPRFARILIDLLYLFSTFRVGKAVEISWITMQSIAHWMLELLESATRLRMLTTKGAMTIMHKHMRSIGATHAVYCRTQQDCWSNDVCHIKERVHMYMIRKASQASAPLRMPDIQ